MERTEKDFHRKPFISSLLFSGSDEKKNAKRTLVSTSLLQYEKKILEFVSRDC